jgi:transcriptional regulator with XRE-family HTH domain
MTANTALKAARISARMSQDDLARKIREAGFRAGDPNGCSRGMVQRWESGKVRCPQLRYVVALESILGRPAESLGFADAALGVDRVRALSDAGMDSPPPVPDRALYDGPHTGIWLSEYEYHSSSRDETFTSRHYMTVLHRGAALLVHSVPASASRVSIDMNVNGQVVTGVWTERTRTEGYYRGAVYYGALQMLLEPTGRRMTGKWVGFGRDMTVNTGGWSLTLVDAGTDDAAYERWNLDPE